MARRRPPSVHGFLVIDKPVGVTSHDVVDVVRRRLGERRVGHGGTLDPDASGVLLVGVGHVTRLLTFLVGHDKRYVGEVVLGVETSTLDASGDVTTRYAMGPVDVAEAQRLATEHLTGPILQVPPMVSALKIGGRRLYELAREGIEVPRAPRPVTVHRFEVRSGPEPGVLTVDVTCSAGTYVRSLAADLGRLLGGGAHLRHLRRLASGGFGVEEAASPDVAVLRPALDALRDFPVVAVDADTGSVVANGRVLPRWDGPGPWAVVGSDGGLLAVYEAFRAGEAKPVVVLAAH